MPARLAFGEPVFREAIAEVFDHYQAQGLDFGYQGAFERRYAEAFVRHMGVPGFADVVCTGTAALYVALAACDLPPGSEVIVSPVTDPGTVNAIILNGMIPVPADSAPGSYNLGVEQYEARVTDHTKAVIVVHAAGKAAPVDAIVEKARRRNIRVIEDCSQAHGARLRGQRVGTFGDLAAISTMYRKAHATGASGGVIFTRDQALYHLARAHADRGKPFWKEGFDDKDPNTFLFPALNFNTDELSCAIGLCSLAKLDETIARRLAFLRQLSTAIRAESQVCTPAEVSDGDSPFYFPVFVDTSRLTCSKVEFAAAVRAEGIDLNSHYQYVVCEWPYLRPYLPRETPCPNAAHCRDASFNLLFNEKYDAPEVRDIVGAIRKVERAYLWPAREHGRRDEAAGLRIPHGQAARAG